MTSRTWRLSALWLALLLLPTGCTDSTDPAPGGTDGLSAGEIDPGAGTFVLQAVDVPMPDGATLRIDLVGSDLTLDPDGEHIDLTVALRNVDGRPLPAPAVVWLQDFRPGPVSVDNADTTLPTMNPGPDSPLATIFGFVYAAEFGEDGVLTLGETSGGRLWRFRTAAQEPFSFATRIQPGLSASAPILGGICFLDLNRNGHPDFDEAPLPPGLVGVLAPDGSRVMHRVGADGRYSHDLTMAGLYTLEWVPGPEVFVDLEFTTPNPLRVLITTDDEGAPQAYLGAHFGAVDRDSMLPPAIRFTDVPLDSLHVGPWTLNDASVVADRILATRVTYSGCQPGHPFSLWTNGNFMESNPVQVDVVLVDELIEDCDAAFMGGYMFDLGPLIRSYRATYPPGVLIVNLVDFAGRRHPVRLEIPRPKGEG